MHGFYNRILTINLKNRSFAIEEISDDILSECL